MIRVANMRRVGCSTRDNAISKASYLGLKGMSAIPLCQTKLLLTSLGRTALFSNDSLTHDKNLVVSGG